MTGIRSPVPTPELAARAAEIHLGWRPVEMRRFATGSAHYVFDLVGADGRRAVARFSLPAHEATLRGGAHLLARVAALGVPVPEPYAVGLLDDFPFMLMERLAGIDLGHVIATLTDPQLQAIAGQVAAAQSAVANFGSAGRYGYSPSPEAAPHETWTGVLDGHMERSRQRMLKAGLFEPGVIAPVGAWLDRLRADLDRIPATPFLHDTTTKNVLVAEGRFTGIVDVDDLCFGDPRYAPALTLAVLMMMQWPEHYVRYWLNAAGHADDEAFRLYVALFLLDLMAEHGQVFNGNEAPSTAEGRGHLLAMLARVLASTA